MYNTGLMSRAIYLATCSLLLLLALSGCSSLKSPTATATSPIDTVQTIQPNVTVGTIPVGGLTAAAAISAIKAAVQSDAGKIRFLLTDPSTGQSFHYSLSDFGGHFAITGAVRTALNSPAGTQIPLAITLDCSQVALHVGRIADLWRVPMSEPKVRFTDQGVQVVTNGNVGREVDVQAATTLAMSHLPTLDNPKVTDVVPFILSHPQVQASKLTGLADTLVSYTTTFNPGNPTRTNNLLLAVKNINGTVVGPGEVFSYNDSVGPRTQQTGFQDAIIYVNNRMKKDVGGGICQASSTLYNCVLLADLPIVERHAHSLPVHYVTAGRDATVAWGGDDFRFRNNTAKPIIIHASATSGGTLTESLIGDRSAMPHPTAKVAIEVTPKVTYSDGFEVKSYRVVKEDGVLIAKEDLGPSFYHNLVGGVPH